MNPYRWSTLSDITLSGIKGVADNNHNYANYIVPPDLFYYCSNDCVIDYVLESLYNKDTNYNNRNFWKNTSSII